MLAVIRARFPNTPASAVWSDTAMQNWLDPNILFSLGHFWTRTSFTGADLRYVLFAPVVINDPRSGMPNDRDVLVRAVLDKVTDDVNPDWDLFDQFIIWFAQQTDMFGGGAYALKTREGSDRSWITGAVVDINSPFDGLCQEVGHAFGFSHELNFFGGEYGSPYSIMSSSGQGSSFERPVDSRLPVGVMPAGKPANYFGPSTNDPERVVGPYVPAAHFYVSGFGPFKHPDSIVEVPASFDTSPFTFRIEALDKAVAAWPQRLKTIAVLPPLVPNGDTFFLELRRQGLDYDQGIAVAGGSVPAAIVVHSHNPLTGRLYYQGSLKLTSAAGDMDYHSYKGFFGVRLNSLDQDLGGANLTVGGGDFWKHFSIDIQYPAVITEPVRSTDWTNGHVRPCFLWEAADYKYRYHFKKSSAVIIATSLGYESPVYTWFLNDQQLSSGANAIDLSIQVTDADNGSLKPPEMKTIHFDYSVNQNRLELSTSAPFTGIYLSLKVTVGESSQEVVQSIYPDRTVWTGFGLSNLEVEWDPQYQADERRCEKMLSDINQKYAKSDMSIIRIPDPGPGPRINEDMIAVIQTLLEINPAAANSAIDAVAKVNKISRLQVLKQL